MGLIMRRNQYMMQQNFHTSPMQMQIFIEWGSQWESDQYVTGAKYCSSFPARLSRKTLVGIYQQHIEESSSMDTCQLKLQWALGIMLTSLDVRNGLWGTRYVVINMHRYKLRLFSECPFYFQSWVGLGFEYILL